MSLSRVSVSLRQTVAEHDPEALICRSINLDAFVFE